MHCVYSSRVSDRLPPPRRGPKRERTKAALVEAFWAIVDEQGFAAATLDAVARRAGMTRGSIYSNFASRAELLLAAAATRGLKIDRDFSRPGTLKAQLRDFAEGLIETLPLARGTQRWHAELMVHIAADPALRDHLAVGFAEMFDGMAAQLRAHHAASLRVEAHSLALAIQSLTMGLVYQAILSPGAVSPKAVFEAFDALAQGAIRDPL